ncbi:MAG: hypothetical protein ACE5HB_01685 [Terriglobia bacterium]
MKSRLHKLALAATLLVAALVGGVPCQAAQNHEELTPGLTALPFEEWLAAGEVKQIPWKVRVSKPYLRTDQRLGVDIAVRIDAKHLNREETERELWWLVRVQDSNREWLNSDQPFRSQLERPLPKDSQLRLGANAVLLPGKYRAVLVLYDRLTGARSVEVRDLNVKPLRSDPLPGAFRDLPPLAFERERPGWDAVYQPHLEGRLWLPVETRGPVQVEILVNFSASRQFTGRQAATRANWANMIRALKPLTELRLTHGTLNVTGVDLNTRRVIFEQQDVTELDWPRLREALSGMNPNMVSVDELQAKKQRAAYFRDLLAERLRSGESQSVAREPARAGAPAPPHRVFIVLSGSMLFPRGSDLEPLQAPAGCDCHLYHLRFPLSFWHEWDELHRVLKPLKPRRFTIRSAMDLRKALGRILSELRQF